MESIITVNLGLSRIYLIKAKKGYILVDTGIGQTEEKLKKNFKTHGIDFSDIKLIIISHAHSDHFMHIGLLKKHTKAKVLCHENAKEWIEKGQDPPFSVNNLFIKLLLKFYKNDFSAYIPVTPDILIKENYDLKDFGIDGHIIHTPGHSACSITVVIQNKWAIIGDILFSSLLNNQKPVLPPIMDDKPLLISSLEKIIETGAEKMLGGHGGPFETKNIRDLIKKHKNNG